MSHVCPANDKMAVLRDRAEMFRKAREFFFERHVCEVDCPAMHRFASVDAHIDLMRVSSCGKTYYLHSSPEYGMKRLLVEGIGDIYQLSHVFRDNESSPRHSLEFTMAEWYRLNFSFSQMIEETVAFIRLFLGNLPYTLMSYGDVFKKYAGIDYRKITEAELLSYLTAKGIEPYDQGKDALLNLIMGVIIEPKLGNHEIFVIHEFPASQSMLSQTTVRNGEEVALRFEAFYKGYELANGYSELADPVEQRKRLEEANNKRLELGKDTLPIDEDFLKAIEKGLPDSCGVAVGFDRLMMLRHGSEDIRTILPL